MVYILKINLVQYLNKYNLICSNMNIGAVAQLGERLPCTEEVAGSTPVSSTNTPLDINPLFYC